MKIIRGVRTPPGLPFAGWPAPESPAGWVGGG